MTGIAASDADARQLAELLVGLRPYRHSSAITGDAIETQRR